MKSEEYILQLSEAVEFERMQEELYYRNLSATKTKAEKKEAGILLYPLKLIKKFYTVGEYIELKLEKTSPNNKGNKINVGAGVLLHFRESTLKGTISFLRKNEVSIILGQKDLDLYFPENESYSIELIYDERPYLLQQSALKKVLNSKEDHIRTLLQAVAKGEINQKSHTLHEGGEHYKNHKLNPYQNIAVQKMVNANQIGIIHGPPGTGKTTTLIALIDFLQKVEKKILVCAPSNNAVDLICITLAEKGLNPTRIGNVSRISNQTVELSLSEKLRNHNDWNHIKKVRVEAEEAKRQAEKYKRQFGTKQRNYRNTMYQEARELKKWARELESKLVDSILDDSKIICATLMGSSHDSIKELNFDTVIIDEASQATVPECWNVILKGKRVILAGDHLQLPPTVKSNDARAMGLEVTLLDRMTDSIPDCVLLQEQYRMNDEILAFSNAQFYQGKLRSHEQCAHRKLSDDSPVLTFIDTSGCGFEEMQSKETRSLRNEGEYFILREHFLSQQDHYHNQSIGIISPYKDQVKYISALIEEEEEYRGFDIQVNSIDGFQGQEKDVIYISLVRSNDQGEIGFLKDYRRLNVAMTRARKRLIIIGDGVTLGQDKMYSALMEHVEQKAHFQSAWEYMKM